MKKVWRDGTRAILLGPLDLIARLCAMIPPPRFNMIRYHGVLAPNARLRSQVVLSHEPRSLADASPAELGDANQLGMFGEDEPKPLRHPWAFLLRHVFLVDVTTCPGCGGRMKWLEVCRERRDIHRVMRAHGLEPRGPPPVEFSSAPWAQLELRFDAGGETRQSAPLSRS